MKILPVISLFWENERFQANRRVYGRGEGIEHMPHIGETRKRYYWREL